MKSEDEIQHQLAYWDSVVADFIQDLAQGRKVPDDKLDKVIEARFRIQDLIWVLGPGESGKASRRFEVTTAVLLELFGDEGGDGETYREKYDANKDRNSRYGIRKRLLKEAERIH